MSLWSSLVDLVRSKPAAAPVASAPVASAPATIVKFEIQVAETKDLERQEKEMLAAIQRGDDGGRAIYGDWLEEHGRAKEAEYVRAELGIRDCEQLPAGPSRDDALGVALRRFQAAARRVDAPFRAYLSRPTIERCVRFELQCPKKWSELALTADPLVRDCGVCRQQVHFCDSVRQARLAASSGKCVVVDLARPRTAGDLDEIQVRMAGRMTVL